MHATNHVRTLTTSLENSVESIYQKKTPLEHVLLRPGMYIGSVETTKDTMWILSESDGQQRMKQQVVEYVPALYKIFDEIIVNAVDNKVRDPTMHHLDVVVDPGNKANGFKPWISVHNDGRGIPVKFHKHEQVYVPELVLGHLLTGSNFDDTSARLTGGRHGYGAKLTNIFSQEFVVETGDTSTGLKYKQVWRNNMRERGEPEITKMEPGEKDFTRVSFSPDLPKFDMDKLTTGMVRVLTKRVFDVAGCLSDVEVTLNGKKLPISGFESYIQAFQHSTTASAGLTTVETSGDEVAPAAATESGGTGAADAVPYIYSRVNKRWQIGVLPSDIGFVQVSFVNGMSALRGGTHVNYVADQLCRRIADHVNKKHAELNITAAQAKPHLALFINCLIENPTFDSQMKEYMSSRSSTYGSTCILSERLSKLVISDSGIVERVVDAARSKQRAALMKKVSSPRSKTSVNVPKLEDANLAGGPRSNECALILTEGDSAKALAVAGLAVVGRDKYGVFPLRGKLLNVRDATVAQLSKNAEFAHLCTILGLKMDEKYDTPEKRQQLRYGKVVIMTDQDHDGSHIKGLLFNLFHTFWPELLESGAFMSEFITPIIKVTPIRKGKGKDKGVLSFFSLPEYFEWKSTQSQDDLKQYSIKYYKGLGTSTSAEGREYFQDLDNHIVDFQWTGDQDGDALDMVFSKSRAGDRKEWLLNEYAPESFLDTSSGSVSYRDFVNKELIQFSHADNARSLPSVVDGLKVSQRKVLFACLKRKLTKEVKVAQLAGYCSEHTAYHHGEASLHSTIVNMAQDYVGANNLPLLYPSGQFGTRLQGGKDAASPRYIFTLLQKYTRMLFPEEDDALLKYVNDDGFPVEPVHYVPILPMLLVNGAEGIGTGWSTSIPCFHPIHVIDNLLHLLEAGDAGEDPDAVKLETMTPWAKGFRGEIHQSGDHSFMSRGKVAQVNATTVRISELPVGKWVEDYKKFLWDLVAKKTIRSFSEHHSERDVRFDVSLSKSDLAKLVAKNEDDDEALVKLFKLESSISTGNMHAFSADGKLTRFDSSENVLRAFYGVRLALYGERKAYLENKQAKELLKLQNRIRFIEQVSHGDLQMVLKERLPKSALVGLLREHGFAPASAFRDELPADAATLPAVPDAEDDNTEDEQSQGAEYDYLLNTSLLSFTKEHTEKLQKEHDGKHERLEQLRTMTPAQVWRHELLQLRTVLLHDKDFHV
uniref:DNA topoisomerase 2 n=1 Tax=Globisporangium ultimum (strain ATCC 200006 / CBS 805.95 / DAOM BR144) TaxID=431595 RepID=K3WUW3_GLOUD